MSSSSTRPRQPVAAPAPPPRSQVNPVTLLISAVAAAVAAFVVSKVWSGGTLLATAMTPVVVALVKEALERPADKVTTLGAKVAPVRARGDATSPRGQAEPTVVQALDPDPTHGQVTVHRTGGRLSRRWVRVGLVTGLLGFAIAAAVFTVPELITGSAASGSRDTTIFGGGSSSSSERDSTPSTTTTTDDEPTTQTTAPTTETTTPTETETAPATTVTAPPTTVTVPPETTTTVPPETTPAPEATEPAPADPGAAAP